MKIKTKNNRIATFLAVNAIAVTLLFLILNTNFLLSPADNIRTRDNTLEFKWIGLGNAIIDDNPDFTSPIEITKDQKAELKPGVYYWKAGLLSNKRKFIVDSEITVSVKTAKLQNETAYRIENKGNTKINIDLAGGITGAVVLEPSAETYQNSSSIEKISVSEK